MSSIAQWRHAYEIAEKMYNSERSMKRTELDENAQLVCSRNDRIFVYDPYNDTYSARILELSLEKPVPSKCRPIAEVDLNAIRKNTLASDLELPEYISMTPIYVVPPSTLLIYNVSQHRVHGLTDALEAASQKLSIRPAEVDIKPGGLFLYRHRDGKLYRVMIIQEIDDGSNPSFIDAERRYEVAFLDVCQMITLKLKNLFMPIPELSLENYPCSVQCARLLGIAAFRSGYVPSYVEDLRALYNDKARRKAGVQTIVYKIEKKYGRFVIDFASLIGGEVTESEALQAIRGHHSLAIDDPLGMNYHQISTRFLHPLEYSSHDEQSNDSDCPPDLPTETSTIIEDCPIGMASMEKFLMQRRVEARQMPSEEDAKPEGQNAKTSTATALTSLHLKQSQVHDQNKLNDSVISRSSGPSFITATSDSTFDVPAPEEPTPTKQRPLSKTYNEERKPEVMTNNVLDRFVDAEETPKKVSEQRKEQAPITKEDLFYSPDGWGEESPDKVSPPGSRSHKSGSEASWEVVDEAKISVQKPTASSSARPILLPHEVVKSPTKPSPPQRKFGQSPDLVMRNEHKIIPTDTSKTQEEIGLNQKRCSSPTTVDTNNQPVSSFPQPPTPSDAEETPRKVRKNGSSQADANSNAKTFDKTIEDVHLDDDVFEKSVIKSEAKSVDQRQDVVPKTLVRGPAKLSTSSITSHMLNDAQANFYDDTDEENWGTKSEVEDIKNVTVRVRDAFHDAFKSMNAIKTKKLQEKIRAHFKKNSSSSQEKAPKTYSELSSVSNKSVCPTELSDHPNGEDVETRSNPDSLSDEFSQVPEALKTLADAFIRSIQEATFEKNRLVFITEVHTLESIALKSTGDLEHRFWLSKVELAKSFESAFD